MHLLMEVAREHFIYLKTDENHAVSFQCSSPQSCFKVSFRYFKGVRVNTNIWFLWHSDTKN